MNSLGFCSCSNRIGCIYCTINNLKKAKEAGVAVRVKGGMSLRNGMWHGLRNDIIMRNVKYGNGRKEIN